MEIHNRFMKLSTTGVLVLEILTDNPDRKSSIIREFVDACYKKLCNGSSDLKILEIFRMSLTHEYQLLVSSRNDEQLESKESSYIDIRRFFIRDIDPSLNAEEFAILYDIAVLQMVLHSNQQEIAKSFKDFYDSRKERLTMKHENKNLSMKVYECFTDTCNLHFYLYGRENRDFDELRNCILTVIGSWMDQEENLEWKLLASILPKLVITFGSENIVTPLWNKVLGWDSALILTEDLCKTLATLCVMADVSFPSAETEIHQTHYEQCVREKFWVILFQGLTSTIYQERKQALYLMKRALDFIDSHKAEIRNELKSAKTNIVPFVSEEHFMYLEKGHFFLILEILEEKQKHLVLPALTHLPSLVKSYSEHKSLDNSFNVVWLQCIFKRIFQHDSNAVQRLALREILNADFDIYNEEFFDFLANSLNNTFLYEYDRPREQHPEIVSQLENFFVRSEQSKMPLINTFVRSISRVSWGPVAIYWILRALVGVTKHHTIIYNAWTIEELKCVKNLVEKSLTMHCRKLRNKSKVLILEAFCGYIRPNSAWADVELIINIVIAAKEDLPLVEDGDEVAECLTQIIELSDAQSCVKRICNELLTNERNSEPCAQTILVLLSSELIFFTNDCPAGSALRQLFENLIDADRRPYADTALILRVIELMRHLIDSYGIQRSSHYKRIIEWCVLPYIGAIVNILKRSFEKTAISTFDKYISAFKIIDHASTFCETAPSWLDFGNLFEGLTDRCINIIRNPHEFPKNQWSYALKVSNLYCYKMDFRQPELVKTYIPLVLKYFKDEIAKDDANDNTESNGQLKRKIRTDCCSAVVKFLDQNIHRLNDLPPLNIRLAKELLFLLEIGTEDVISPVASILSELIQTSPSLVIQDLDIVYHIIRLCWRSTFQMKRTNVFYETVQGLMHLIVNSAFLKLDGAKEFAVGCVDQLMREGESLPTLKLQFFGCLQHLLLEDVPYFYKALISCILHGAVPRRDQRIERAAISHLSFDINDEIQLRIKSIIALLKILAKFDGLKSELRENILKELIGTLEKNRNKRYFDNSHVHMLKNRVMQTLLIMEPFLDAVERQILHDAICDLLIAESNQPSVRLMQEWILVRMYGKNSIMRDSLWELFAKATENRPGSIVSIASVVFHVSRLLEGDAKNEFIAKSIMHLLPNCMGQQFNVRLYSQAILVKIFKTLPEDSHEANKYRRIYQGVRESLRHGKLTKNSFKVLDNFYFEIFHPEDDYNVEGIYYHIPRLTGVSVDEWIEPDDFYLFWPNTVEEPMSIARPRSKSRTALATIEACTIQFSRSTGELDEATDLSMDGGLGDVQKKIIPWKSMVPFYDELSDVSKAALSQRKMGNDDAGIIVVACLIDRPPNLGGLARTCEIFGAKELVIGSLKYADDREFRTLSVSAERWITITEVKPHLLQNYLLEKHSKGWKLVGAEQTANSTNLLDMKFDKKTILLLGNEKDGIPANLIPLLDTCVEIPQNGVVRSLNVHVTGAICVWQYVKQHVLT